MSDSDLLTYFLSASDSPAPPKFLAMWLPLVLCPWEGRRRNFPATTEEGEIQCPSQFCTQGNPPAPPPPVQRYAIVQNKWAVYIPTLSHVLLMAFRMFPCILLQQLCRDPTVGSLKKNAIFVLMRWKYQQKHTKSHHFYTDI